MINHSQDLDFSRFRSIIHKTLAYQDYDQLFTRLGHIKTLINHLQDLGIYIQTYAHYELDMPVLPMINQSLVNDESKYGYAKVLPMIDRSPDMPKSCK